MKMELHIGNDLGSHLADGFAATNYRRGRIDPYVGIYDEIVLDFGGVRTANSSFINGLIVGLIEQHGAKVLRSFVFKRCNPVIQALVRAGVDLGMAKTDHCIGA